jgi:hypothetical protein
MLRLKLPVLLAEDTVHDLKVWVDGFFFGMIEGPRQVCKKYGVMGVVFVITRLLFDIALWYSLLFGTWTQVGVIVLMSIPLWLIGYKVTKSVVPAILERSVERYFDKHDPHMSPRMRQEAIRVAKSTYL